jgi:WD40 repeat protein
VSARELLAILDEELHRLPEAFRLPLVLCCLEGRSQEEAAALLGWTPGSVKGRLERGRQRLKARLARRGLTFAAAVGAPLLIEPPCLAGVLRQATLRAALVEAASASAFIARCRMLVVVALLGLVGIGTSLALLAGPKGTGESATQKPASPQADAPGEGLPEGAVVRLGSPRLRIGHSAFALTPDGRAIVTVSPQGVVRKFDARSGRLLERRQISDRRDADPRWPFHVQLSADGRTAAIEERGGSGRANPRVTVWDVPSGKLILRPRPDKGRRLYWPALAPSGKLLTLFDASSDGDEIGTLRVYDLKTGRWKALDVGTSYVNGIRFSADGRRMVLCQSSRPRAPEGLFACFDLSTGKRLWQLPRKGGEYQFAVSPDGKTVAAAVSLGQSGFQVITDADSPRPAERFQPCSLAWPHVRIVFAPDNRTLVMNQHAEGMLATWDIRTGKAGKALRLPQTRGPWGGGFRPELGAMSPDGRTVITNLNHLQRWDLTTGKPLFEAPPGDGLGWSIERLAFTPDGKHVVASSVVNTGRWEVATGKEVHFAREELEGYKQLVTTADGLRALRCSAYRSPHQVMVSDPVGGKAARTVRCTTPVEVGGLRAFALTADGKTLLVAHADASAGMQKTCVTACDVASERRLAGFAVKGSFHFEHSPFSPCGRWVVLGGKVYHVGTGRELFAPAGAAGERLVPSDQWHMGPWFSPDGRLLAGRLSGKAGDSLAVWELASGTLLARFPKARRVAQAAFARDGRTVALLDGWGVEIHDVLTGKRLAAYPAPDVTTELKGLGCGTQTLAFAPDGRTLATGHLDGTILLWKVPPVTAGANEIAERDREALWADLGSDVPRKARAALERLARRPAVAVSLLASRFRPPPADLALAAIVKDLDSDVFATRQEATRKLREHGPKAELVLRRELAATASLEVKRRIEALLAGLTPPALRLPLAGDTLRGVRAIEVLERAGTPQARRLLQGWAEQTRDLHLAAEARGVLGRAPRK